MSRLKTVRQREKILSYSNLCSIQAFNRIGDVPLHVGECIRILLRQTDRQRLTYYAIMEDEKSHNMLSASWRLRKTSDIIPVQVWSLGNWGADGINPSPKTGKDSCLSSIRQAERGSSLPSSAFGSL